MSAAPQTAASAATAAAASVTVTSSASPSATDANRSVVTIDPLVVCSPALPTPPAPALPHTDAAAAAADNASTTLTATVSIDSVHSYASTARIHSDSPIRMQQSLTPIPSVSGSGSGSSGGSGSNTAPSSRSLSNASDLPPSPFQSAAIDSAAAASHTRPPPLPILSLPTRPGQSVCTCMRAVVEGSTHWQPMSPTSPENFSVTPAASATPAALSPSARPPPFPTATTSPSSSSSSSSSASNANASMPTSAGVTGTNALPLESLLSLQDRFWLGVGEVTTSVSGVAIDSLAFERGVESMETLCVQLAHLSQSLSHTIVRLKQDQLIAVQPILLQLENKHAELVQMLNSTCAAEAQVREKIDACSQRCEKAKKTVAMSTNLKLPAAKQQREQQHLDNMRKARDAAVAQLEAVVGRRSTIQAQLLNVATIAAEARIQEERLLDRRDYKLMYRQVNTAFFKRSFGEAYQQQVSTLVKVLAKLRQQSHECERRRSVIEHTIHELRTRIAVVVAAVWK